MPKYDLKKDDTKKEMGKAHEASTLDKNYGQLKNAESRRHSLP